MSLCSLIKKLLPVILMSVTCSVSRAFVVKVTNIPDTVSQHPLTLESQLTKITLDSVPVVGGNALFHGDLDKAELCKIGYSFDIVGGVVTYFVPVFLGNDNDTVKVRLTETFERGGAEVSGGELNEKREEILKEIKNMPMAEFIDFTKKRAAENRSNPLGVLLTGMLSTALTPDSWLGLYHELTPDMAKYPNLIEESDRIRALEATNEGQMFQDFQCLTPEGNVTRLSDYLGKGKYVLLDFWASWCGPCRREAKETLTPLYEKNKDNDNFMILGMMTSDDTQNHLEALKTIHYPWQQLIDSERLAGKSYGFQFIPCIMLISPDGKIIRRNLRGEEIPKYVDEVLGNKN